MISKQSSLTSIVAAAAIASGVLLVTANPAEACPLKFLKSGKWGALAAAGVAAVAGLGAVGITSLRRQDPTDILEVPEADAEAASEYMIETVLSEVPVKEEAPATETSQRELTLVK